MSAKAKKAQAKEAPTIVRTIRLELVKPLSESWDEIGPTLRLLASVTPKLTNAAYDALAAIRIAGAKPIKEAVCPDTRGASPDAIAYQATAREMEKLRAWKPKGKDVTPYHDVEVSGVMMSSISRAASQAFARRDQGRVSFSSPRIIVHGNGASFAEDDRGVTVSLMLRSKGKVTFACAHSDGRHRETIGRIVSGRIKHGDVKLQYDDERRKWYALVSYKMPEPEPVPVDPRRVLVIHRGIRNALYAVCSSTATPKALRGDKFVHQRRALQQRQRSAQRITSEELGVGAKGHGRARRHEHASVLEDKLARVTTTWCQQAAAWVAHLAVALGCGLVVIEDYGGIEPASDRALRRVLERFPFFELKQSIANTLERMGIELAEVASAWISSQCPACETLDPRAHNTRTGVFHCRVCAYERDADFVSAYWMMAKSGRADMSVWKKKFDIQLSLSMRSRTREAAE